MPRPLYQGMGIVSKPRIWNEHCPASQGGQLDKGACYICKSLVLATRELDQQRFILACQTMFT